MIKKGNPFKKEVDTATKVQLIRKGNQLLTDGDIQTAEKIFITIDYKDGLVRLGDYYLSHNNLYKCAQMYFLSENSSKINSFCKRSAKIIEKMINDDEKIYNKIIKESINEKK